MHVVTSICDPDGAIQTLPPQEVTSPDVLPVNATQYSFDTEEEAMAQYSELKPQPSFLFTADCHMKRRTWTNSTLLQGDAPTSLWSLVLNALDIVKDCRTLVIGGDLFDNNRPASQDMVDVSEVVKMFCQTFYIRGNHDSVKPSYLEALKDTSVNGGFGDIICIEPDKETDSYYTHFHRISNHAYIAGIQWMPSDSQFIELLKGVVSNWHGRKRDGDKLYLVLHCTFKHLLNFDGAYQIDANMLKDIVGDEDINVLVGHIHTRDTLVYNDHGNYIHSPGSTYPLSADKMQTPCYGSIIMAETGDIIPVDCNVRKYVNVNIADLDKQKMDLDRFIIPYKPNDHDLPTFINLVVPEDYDKQIVLPENDSYVWKIDRRLSALKERVAQSNKVYTIEDAVREELQNEANREMVTEMAEELLIADDPVAVLTEWLEFWGVRKATC